MVLPLSFASSQVPHKPCPWPAAKTTSSMRRKLLAWEFRAEKFLVPFHLPCTFLWPPLSVLSRPSSSQAEYRHDTFAVLLRSLKLSSQINGFTSFLRLPLVLLVLMFIFNPWNNNSLNYRVQSLLPSDNQTVEFSLIFAGQTPSTANNTTTRQTENRGNLLDWDVGEKCEKLS